MKTKNGPLDAIMDGVDLLGPSMGLIKPFFRAET